MVNGEPKEESSNLQVRTMDTTSNNWTFQTFTFGGGGGSSVLNDVAIINDTLAFAVGEIYLKDSTTGQPDPQPYNLAVWNGSDWKLQKIPYYYQGQPFYGPIYSVFAFGAGNIWFGIGNMIHWDGQLFNSVELPPSVWGPHRINKIWGAGSNLYIVGDGGSIARYDGGVWTKIESGTNTDIDDACGITNPTTGKVEVYCAVTNFFQPADKRILRITDGDKVDSVSWSTGRDVVSVWTPDGSHLYACGDGVFENLAGTWREMKTGASIYTNCIRGNAPNDIVVVGGYGFIAHWNGASFRIYPPAMDVIYTSVAITGNLIVAVGTTGAKAVVTIGRR